MHGNRWQPMPAVDLIVYTQDQEAITIPQMREATEIVTILRQLQFAQETFFLSLKSLNKMEL